MNKAIIGGWAWKEDPNNIMGLNVAKVENDKITILGNYFPEVKVGSKVSLGSNGLVYFVHESKDSDDLKNEGSYVYAAKINENDTLCLISKVKTYAINPCYCALDKTEKYLIVVHHGSSRSIATKLVKDENGNVFSKIVHDDAAIELFEINDDGSIGNIVDFDIKEELNEISLIHSVYRVSDNLFLIVDKGMDSVYSYSIDYDNKKLCHIDSLKLHSLSHPRYLDYKDNIAYICAEKEHLFYTVSFNESGKFTLVNTTKLSDNSEAVISGASDMCVNRDNNVLYCLVRGDDINADKVSNKGLYHVIGDPSFVYIYDINDPENPLFLEYYKCDGLGSRSLTLNNGYLYTMDGDSSDVSIFKVDGKSLIKCTGTKVNCAANMVFYKQV